MKNMFGTCSQHVRNTFKMLGLVSYISAVHQHLYISRILLFVKSNVFRVSQIKNITANICNVSSVGPSLELEKHDFLSDEGPSLETFDLAFYIGSTPTFLYFDLYLNTAYAAHYVYLTHTSFTYTSNHVNVRCRRGKLFLKFASLAKVERK